MGTKVFSTHTYSARTPHVPLPVKLLRNKTKLYRLSDHVNNVNNQSYFYKQHPFSCAKKTWSQKWKFYVIKSDILPRYVLKRLIHLETYFFGSNPKYSTANFELLLTWYFKLWFTRSQVLCQDKEINKLYPIK